MVEQENLASFEEAIKKLEAIVKEIESDNIKLEVALTKYQEGVKLVQFCQAKLAEVEQEVKILDSESDTLKDFIAN